MNVTTRTVYLGLFALAALLTLPRQGHCTTPSVDCNNAAAFSNANSPEAGNSLASDAVAKSTVDPTPIKALIVDLLLGRPVDFDPLLVSCMDANHDGVMDVSDLFNDLAECQPLEFVPVPAGTFTMGRTNLGDDGIYGSSVEIPNHEVTLSAYDMGKFEVTNAQFAKVMNWALAKGYLANNTSGAAYSGAGNVYFMAPDSTSNRQLLFDTVTGSSYTQIEWTGTAFATRTRDSQSMAPHPVVQVTWFGAVAFCNFISEMAGKPPAYDLSTWELIDADPVASGVQYVASYRLPTESEWECAAAWGQSKHWIYSIVSDTLTGKDRANYADTSVTYVNPMGLKASPFTSPVGWFNGTNISPNGNVATVNSPSPVGAYDMSGNVYEWCHDWYGNYTSTAKTDPTGAASGGYRIIRGGGCTNLAMHCRSASRNAYAPTTHQGFIGFRIVAIR